MNADLSAILAFARSRAYLGCKLVKDANGTYYVRLQYRENSAYVRTLRETRLFLADAA